MIKMNVNRKSFIAETFYLLEVRIESQRWEVNKQIFYGNILLIIDYRFGPNCNDIVGEVC